jgi:hypothetical protein
VSFARATAIVFAPLVFPPRKPIPRSANRRELHRSFPLKGHRAQEN